jgi:cell division transport system ATP-binding protein
MVEFRAVSKSYVRRKGGAPVPVLVDATFEVGSGEAVVLTGPAGSGKSTLLRLLTGEERPTGGRVLVDGEDVATLGRRGVARLRRGLGVVPAEPRLVADRTAFQNVAVVLRALGASRRAARAAGLAALREAGLATKSNAFPAELTAGERRRLCLARALAGAPPLLLADEPTAGLDEATAAQVVELLRRARGQGSSLLVTSQAVGLAASLGARALTLEGGRVSKAGESAPAPPPSPTDSAPQVDGPA